MADRVSIDNTCAAPGCRAARDRRLTFRLLLLLPACSAALRLGGFRRAYGAAEWLSARSVRRPPGGSRTPQQITDLVVHVNRHVLPYQSKCLLESLALWYLLRRCGYDATFCLGARTLLGPFEAHAWVELNGKVLNDAPNVRDVYEPFEIAAISARPESQ
jgi:hypothetical protein